MKKEKKTKTTKDKEYKIGYHLGIRESLEFIAKEGFIDPLAISYLLGEEFFRRKKNLKK